MATLKQLRERWRTPQGAGILQQLSSALQQRSPLAGLKSIIAGLPYVEEVAPALDLRAMPMDATPQLFKVDLPGARFDHVEFPGNIVECKMAGAVFDGVSARNRLFNGDFAGASFIGAKLAGAYFKTVRLTNADFSKASMMRAQLTEQRLQGARFVEADLRTAELAGSDIRGADFTGADCSDATFGKVVFDATTRLNGCRLTAGYMLPEFEAYARAQGADILGNTGQEGYREIDATIAVLKGRNQNGRYDSILAMLKELRERAGRDPGWDWLGFLMQQLPKEQAEALQAAFEEGYRHMEHYLA